MWHVEFAQARQRTRVAEAFSLAAAMAGTAASVTVVGLMLVPAGRPFAYVGLLTAVWLVARRGGWDFGRTGAMAAALVYLWAHGRPRFEPTVTDQLTIRSSLVLLLLGLAAAWLADRRHRVA